MTRLGVAATWLALAGGVAFAATPQLEGIPPDKEQRIRSALPASCAVTPKAPRRVLVWNTPPHLMEKDPHKGYCVPYGACAFRLMGEKTGAFTAVFTNDVSVFLPDHLRRFDAVVMNNSCGAWITPDDPTLERCRSLADTREKLETLLRQSLLDFVTNGGGIVACHYAIGANRHWPEFAGLLGATFTGHPWNEEVAVRVDAPEHPLTAAFAGKPFRITDEIYEFGPPYDRSKLTVLLSLDPDQLNLSVPHLKRKDHDFAQAWTRPYGKGRVFYCGFGHRTEVWWNPAVLRFYLDAIQFATGDLAAPPPSVRTVHSLP